MCLSVSLHKELGFLRINTILRECGAKIVHCQHSLGLILSATRAVRGNVSYDIEHMHFVKGLTLADDVPAPRPRPPGAAFVRMRACWYASAAISETNFCAARDSKRFLRAINFKRYGA